MRLYLSSFRIGDHPAELTRLAPPPGPALIIANACDDAEPADRRSAVEAEAIALGALGYRTRELDLRDHLDEPAALPEELSAAALLWVRGGNVFALRHALHRTGADAMISRLLTGDAVVYAGYSAGPCVLAPSLRGLEACDDPGAVERVWGEPATCTGLGVLDYAIVPHVDTPDHPESSVLEQVASRYAAAGVPHRTLRDGDVLVVEGDSTRVLPRRH